ncbi:MAG: 3-deoxy-8-phosphooctulonate synthase [Planctomycetota bacterium]
MPKRTTRIANLTAGDPARGLLIIAGPCQAESYDMCVQVGEAMRDRCEQLGFQYIFKASFDKANRSSIHSQRGPGLDEGLALLAKVKATLGTPITTDIHEPSQAQPAADAGVELLQIPAFLCRQTDLLVACAATGSAVNVKKGQFLSPAEMNNVVIKLDEAEASGVMLTERGTFFGYHRLVNDFVGVADMMELGVPSGPPPVCFDVTHSTQHPGGSPDGKTTGGRRDRAPMLARCAVAADVDALFLETHPDPDHALSDAATMLPLETAEALLGDLAKLRETCRSLAVR